MRLRGRSSRRRIRKGDGPSRNRRRRSHQLRRPLQLLPLHRLRLLLRPFPRFSCLRCSSKCRVPEWCRPPGLDGGATTPVDFRLHFVTDDLRRWIRDSAEFINQIAEGSGGRLTFESILDALSSGHYRLAVVLDGESVRAAMVWQPIHWKTGLKEFEVIGLTGKGMRDWLHLDDELKKRVFEIGFDVIRPYARPGWSRVMKSRGYVTTHVIMEYRK